MPSKKDPDKLLKDLKDLDKSIEKTRADWVKEYAAAQAQFGSVVLPDNTKAATLYKELVALREQRNSVLHSLRDSGVSI